jgi:hypothetical protein
VYYFINVLSPASAMIVLFFLFLPVHVACNDGVPSSSARTYTAAKARQVENWISLRNPLVRTYIESLAPSDHCVICGCVVEEIFRCEDCVCLTTVCKVCVEDRHAYQPFHRIYMWKVNYQGHIFNLLS